MLFFIQNIYNIQIYQLRSLINRLTASVKIINEDLHTIKKRIKNFSDNTRKVFYTFYYFSIGLFFNIKYNCSAI
jgi:hypothetical protein